MRAPNRAIRASLRTGGGVSGWSSIPRKAPWRAKVRPHFNKRHRWVTLAVKLDLPAAVDSHQPAEHGFGSGAGEAGLGDHCAELLRARETLDRFDEITIARFIVGYRLAEPRNDVLRPGVIQLREAGPVAAREFHAEEASAALEDAMRFLQRCRNVGDVPDAEDNRVSVEGGVAEAQHLGVFDLPTKAGDLPRLGALPPDLQHVRVDVGYGDLRAATREPKRDVARAARHVEDMLSGARLHSGDEAVLPEPVHPARHKVVHHVVAARDGAEDLADAARLLLGADQLLAEIHLLRRSLRHGPRL